MPRVIARSRNNLHGEVLRRVGADQVVYPERDMGYQVAHSFYSPSVLAKGHRLAIVAIQRGQEVILLPSADERLRPGDAVVAMGPDEELDRLLNRRG